MLVESPFAQADGDDWSCSERVSGMPSLVHRALGQAEDFWQPDDPAVSVFAHNQYHEGRVNLGRVVRWRRRAP